MSLQNVARPQCRLHHNWRCIIFVVLLRSESGGREGGREEGQGQERKRKRNVKRKRKRSKEGRKEGRQKEKTISYAAFGG